jgi:hypothetical protein
MKSSAVGPLQERSDGLTILIDPGAGKKKPRAGGALSFLLHRFERPGSSLSARAERAFRIQMNPRSAPARRVITSI